MVGVGGMIGTWVEIGVRIRVGAGAGIGSKAGLLLKNSIKSILSLIFEKISHIFLSEYK